MTSYQPNSKGVVILGMHRSGTSCLAGMLELAGFWSGAVEEWNPDNLKGNRENTDIVNLNTSLFRYVGGSWDKPPSRPIKPEPRHVDVRDEIIASLTTRPEPWMFKDPRTLLTLPFWLEALPGAQLIGVFRYPVSVANSLLVRNNMPLPDGLRLWQTYNQRLLELLHEGKCPILLFSEDLALFTECSEKFVNERFPEAVQKCLVDPSKMGAFASQQLVHQPDNPLSNLPAELADLGVAGDLAASICTMWNALIQRTLNPPDRKDQRRSDSKRSSPPAPSFALAEIQLEAETEKKLASLERLIFQQPLRSDLWHYGLKILEETGDHVRIRQWIEKGLDAMGADPVLMSRKADLEWLSGDQELAISMIEEVVEKTHGWAPALRTLSRWRFARQEWEQAANAYHEILDRGRPVSEESHFIQLFIDSGEGFSEESSIRFPVKSAKIRQRFEFSLLGLPMVHKLRLDPLNDYSVVKMHDICLLDQNDQDLDFEISGTNARSKNGDTYYFTLKDCQIEIRPAEISKTKARKLVVSLEFPYTGPSALEACLARIESDGGRVTTAAPREESRLNYDFSVLESIGSVKKPIVDELNFILAWSIETKTSKEASPGHQLLHGWICTTGNQAVNLVLKYNGATRSYPMNVDRPDIWKAVARKPENLHHVTCGFSYEVPESTAIEIGVDHKMKLYWLESLLT